MGLSPVTLTYIIPVVCSSVQEAEYAACRPLRCSSVSRQQALDPPQSGVWGTRSPPSYSSVTTRSPWPWRTRRSRRAYLSKSIDMRFHWLQDRIQCKQPVPRWLSMWRGGTTSRIVSPRHCHGSSINSSPPFALWTLSALKPYT